MPGKSGRRTATATFRTRTLRRGCGSSWRGRAWTHAEGPYRLFEQAVGWLRRNKVLLPGVSVLCRPGTRECGCTSTRPSPGQIDVHISGDPADCIKRGDPAPRLVTYHS